MKLLVIGGGGREHALAWKLAREPARAEGLRRAGQRRHRARAGRRERRDHRSRELVDFAAREQIYLTVVGPEAPLAAGVVDLFRAARAAHLRPDARRGAARELQGLRQGVPRAARHPDRRVRDVHRCRGRACVRRRARRADRRQGRRARRRQGRRRRDDRRPRRTRRSTGCWSSNAMGEAGARVVIEEFLDGEEASFIVMFDGERTCCRSRPARTTSACATATRARTPAAWARTRRRRSSRRRCTRGSCARSSRRRSAGWRRTGCRTPGFLYAGLMIDAAGNPKVLEFNCRLGDPETQPILVRLKSDLLDLLEHAVDGKLDSAEAEWDRRAALGVVLAAHGYPEAPRKGDVDRRPRRSAGDGLPRLPCRHGAGRRQGRRERRARAVRHRARRHRQAGAERAYEAIAEHPLRRHAVPARHRLPRDRPAPGLTATRRDRDRERSARPAVPVHGFRRPLRQHRSVHLSRSNAT